MLTDSAKTRSMKKIYNGGSFLYYDYYNSDHNDWLISTLHRTDGHAYEDFNGEIGWWVNGKRYTVTTEYCKAANMDNECYLYYFLKYGDMLLTHIDDL